MKEILKKRMPHNSIKKSYKLILKWGQIASNTHSHSQPVLSSPPKCFNYNSRLFFFGTEWDESLMLKNLSSLLFICLTLIRKLFYCLKYFCLDLFVLLVVPGVERVFPGNNMGAVPSHKHLDSVIKGADSGLGHWTLLDNLQRVSGASAQRAVLTGSLDAAVWVHAVCQTIWHKEKQEQQRIWKAAHLINSGFNILIICVSLTDKKWILASLVQTSPGSCLS